MSSLGPDDLVLSSRAALRTGFRDYVESASRAGFRGVSLWGGDYDHARAAGLSERDMRAILDDNGVEIAELDGIVDWLNPLPRPELAGFALDVAFFGHDEQKFYRIADALGARSITVVDPFSAPVPLDRMLAAFAAICDRAAAHGLLVHLEFLSWGAIPDLATAWQIVAGAARDNSGLVIDSLHLTRSNSLAALANIPGEKIFTTQFSDAAATRTGDAFADAASRQLPGEGELDLAAIVRQLDAIGSQAPIGVEVFNAELSALSTAEAAQRLSGAMRGVLATARPAARAPR